ncbi:hypothetical protein ACPCHT_28570 [Nucisporomicrobium flavum]|uniref:hypothetical protein n=1 Tax=Nucisporomicrobium flavum TaxID=2785915 RepID=UPI003C3076B4
MLDHGNRLAELRSADGGDISPGPGAEDKDIKVAHPASLFGVVSACGCAHCFGDRSPQQAEHLLDPAAFDRILTQLNEYAEPCRLIVPGGQQPASPQSQRAEW